MAMTCMSVSHTLRLYDIDGLSEDGGTFGVNALTRKSSGLPRYQSSATARLGDPTHGAVVGDSFYFIANSGWDSLDEHGAVKEGKILTAPSLMRAKLNRPG
jgi:hypothetical protein